MQLMGPRGVMFSGCSSICAYVRTRSMRMSDTCVPKQLFCGQLAEEKQLTWGRHKCYKDGLKQNLKTCGIPPTDFNSATTAGWSWRSRCHDAIDDFEATCVGTIQAKWQARKTDPEHWTVGMWLLRSCLWFLDRSLYTQKIPSMGRYVVCDSSLHYVYASVLQQRHSQPACHWLPVIYYYQCIPCL